MCGCAAQGQLILPVAIAREVSAARCLRRGSLKAIAVEPLCSLWPKLTGSDSDYAARATKNRRGNHCHSYRCRTSMDLLSCVSPLSGLHFEALTMPLRFAVSAGPVQVVLGCRW